MRGTLNLGRPARSLALLLAVFSAAHDACGDDLTTLSGQTFHEVQPLRVEPDGVTWRYAEGVVKVDFSDSPEKVRSAYHYDPARAGAYQGARAKAQRQADEQTRQLLQTQDERLRAQAQAQVRVQAPAAPAASAPLSGTTVTYRHGLAPAVEAASRSLGEQMAAAKAREVAAARNAEGLGNLKLWSLVPGVGSAPVAQRVDLPSALEYKLGRPSDILVPNFGASQSDAGAFAPGSAQNDFFKPIYMTKSYDDEVDRAAAFARGTPLK